MLAICGSLLFPNPTPLPWNSGCGPWRVCSPVPCTTVVWGRATVLAIIYNYLFMGACKQVWNTNIKLREVLEMGDLNHVFCWARGVKVQKQLNWTWTLEKNFNIRNKIASFFFSLNPLLLMFCSQLLLQVENLINATFAHSVKPGSASQASKEYGVIFSCVIWNTHMHTRIHAYNESHILFPI